MKLRTIAEVQRKWTSTKLRRTNASGARAASFINDIYKKPKKKSATVALTTAKR
jgi:hypothetical protein